MLWLSKFLPWNFAKKLKEKSERSGLIECLPGDRRVAGWSLTANGINVLKCVFELDTLSAA